MKTTIPNHKRDTEPANGEVKPYKLSPEELEKYRKLPKPEGKKPVGLVRVY